MTYHDFLETTTWRRTAARLRRKANDHCHRCGARCGKLTVHHTDYDVPNRFDAPDWVPAGWLPDDVFLECLCSECHDCLHGRGPDPTQVPTLRELMEMVEKWTPRI